MSKGYVGGMAVVNDDTLLGYSNVHQVLSGAVMSK